MSKRKNEDLSEKKPPSIKLQYKQAKERGVTPEERRKAYEEDLKAEYNFYYQCANSLPKTEALKPKANKVYDADQEMSISS